MNFPIFRSALELTVTMGIINKASFENHIKHSNSYNLTNKVGVIHESNPFDTDRV